MLNPIAEALNSFFLFLRYFGKNIINSTPKNETETTVKPFLTGTEPSPRTGLKLLI